MAKLQRVEGPSAYTYEGSGVWIRQATTGPERLVAEPRGRAIELVTALARTLEEPFVILYVLLVSRLGQLPGRYESPELERAECEAFLKRYKGYFENDGRHHVWVLSRGGTIVYDNHERVYAYGPLDEMQRAVELLGLRSGEPAIPYPHTHCYNAEFDGSEEQIMGEWNWKHCPLHNSDDDG
jgi:hypothetical protein